MRAHDRTAWERLVALYGPLVYRWCRAAGLAGADAEDVGQDVFAAVHRKVRDFRRQRPGDTFRGWLRVITRNKLRDRARRQPAEGPGQGGSDPQRLLLQVPTPPAGPSAAEAGSAADTASGGADDRSETVLVARRALDLLRDELTEANWQVFYRVVVEGQAPAVVAADLGLSLNAIYLTKSRGLRRLREEFAGLLEVDDAS